MYTEHLKKKKKENLKTYYNVIVPFLSSSFFFAASSLSFLIIARRARSALASSDFPAKCIFKYRALAFCFSISSLWDTHKNMTMVWQISDYNHITLEY